MSNVSATPSLGHPLTAESVAAQLGGASRRVRRQLAALHRALRAGGVELTAHAVERAAELGFSLDEVIRTACDPELSCTAPMNRTRCLRDDVVVITEHRGGRTVVVTVLLRVDRRWKHGLDTRHSLREVG